MNAWLTRSLQSQTLAKRFGFFTIGTVLTVFYAQLVYAQSLERSSTVQNPYSIETILAAIIGAIITVFFLRGMYLVLTYASETYGLEGDEDLDHDSDSQENNALLYGAFGWIIGSALIIASYGWGWQFLYIGPIVCLLGPLVPVFAMKVDIEKYKRVLFSRAATRRLEPFR
jgi:uncharacterized protein YacL